MPVPNLGTNKLHHAKGLKETAMIISRTQNKGKVIALQRVGRGIALLFPDRGTRMG